MAAFLAAPAILKSQDSAARTSTPEEADAAAALKKNLEAIAKVEVDRKVEPAFRFEA